MSDLKKEISDIIAALDPAEIQAKALQLVEELIAALKLEPHESIQDGINQLKQRAELAEKHRNELLAFVMDALRCCDTGSPTIVELGERIRKYLPKFRREREGLPPFVSP